MNWLEVSLTVNGELAEAVADVLVAQAMPVVLAGNCITSVGTLSGLHTYNITVLWLDAHADYNTPETSTSGYLDGMALSVACGKSWQSLAAKDPRYLPANEERVALIGAHNIDPKEAELLKSSRITRITLDQLRRDDYRLPGDSDPTPPDLFIHLDADVLDSSIGHANEFASPGGLTEADATRVLTRAGTTHRICGLAVTAFSPAHDGRGTIREALQRLILHVARTALETDANPAPR